MSYLQIKRFIDEQIQILNRPLVIDDNLRAIMAKNNISEETMKSIVFKANIRLKRHNRYRFNKQVVHQIVQQVAKNEKEKLVKVNDALIKIDLMMQPVLLPDFSKATTLGERIRMVNELVDELPEPEYLFALTDSVDDGKNGDDNDSDDNEGNDVECGNESETETNMLVQDDEERVDMQLRRRLEKQYEREVSKELKNRLASLVDRNKELKLQYTQLRDDLLALNEEIVYELQKLEYLKNLNGKLKALRGVKAGALLDSEDEDSEVEESSVDMDVQMKRFSILVEKLQFAMK